jgi:hypothetical protein
MLASADLGMFFAATGFCRACRNPGHQGYPGVLQRFMTRYRGRHRERLLAHPARRMTLPHR